jgi:adenine C2-methylase RlmN of 23S rRNA A2503 and tRNA A37
LEVLEQLLAEIDKRLDSLQPLQIYKWLYNRQSRDVDKMRQIHEDHAREGYVRVRKVIIDIINRDSQVNLLELKIPITW